MPPYPLYNEPSIPGAAGLDTPIATSSPNPQNLQTHSSKFPIEREVILSSSDKNSKIPILNDYIKRTKGAIAPDVPPKQMSAWSNHTHHQILSPDQNHSGHTHPMQNDGAVFRATYHNPGDYYSTGAVPRSTWQGELAKTQAQRQYEEYTQQQISGLGQGHLEKEKESKTNKTMTKTYHTIKDIISSKFKSNKDVDDKHEEAGLNNVTEEMRKSLRNIDGNGNPSVSEESETAKKTAGEQGIYGKPRTAPETGLSPQQHHQMQQQIIQQQILVQQQQQYKNQQLMQARSQEMLASRPEDYYQNPYLRQQQQQQQQHQTPQRFPPTQYMPMHSPMKETKEKLEERRSELIRSPQQLERDNIRQRSFEARRTASQPQLSFEDEVNKEIPDNRPQPQAQPLRRGSQGNLVETIRACEGKDSDEGGFVRKPEETGSKPEDKVNSALTGAPRKRLEGEIGKIEGVYNIQPRKDAESRKNNPSSAASSDYDKAGQSSSNADSGRGSAAYSSGRRPGGIDTSNESDNHQTTHNGRDYRDLNTPGHDSEWVDIVETELRHILEPKLHGLTLQGNSNIANSTLSESISSMTPPLPPLSPGEQSSPNVTPRNSTRYKHASLPYGSKPEYDLYKSKGVNQRWHGGGSTQKHRGGKKIDHSAILRSKQIFGLDTADMTSTTTRSMDLESMLDGQSDSDGDLSTADARTIRKQLEGLEGMYSEVLKLLGVKKYSGRYQPSDPRFSKRRYGSMSSLPSSSVSSRPIRDKRRAHEDRKKVRDIRGINKRFQRLESHVVTLARSVAHLSSEMRTQHLMIQEMENIRGEIAALRTQTNMMSVRNQSANRQGNMNKDLPDLANPTRVKKLTKFFGDEPPLLRLFLRKLGYEKYANAFENERIGMVELPYLSEERLQKIGVPLGPRLRIMEEAQISVCKDNTLCIV
ncbi:uncharacterized protein [Atheta coriaria]